MATIEVHDWNEFITAVGTTDADVVFPHSSEYIVKTQDVNVDPNKLYLDSNNVVQTNVQPGDLVNLYENTFVLDANDYAPEGLESTITVNCTSINGYGACIKNIFSANYPCFTINNTNFTMDNMRILNLYLNDHFLYSPNDLSDDSGCTKCIFSANINNGNNVKYFINNYHMFFRQCSIYLMLIGKTLFIEETYPNFNKLEYCRVDIDAQNVGTNILPGINSYFSGTFPTEVHATMPINYTNLYCIYDINCPSILAGTWTAPVRTCVCNIDKCRGAHQYLLEATTEQLSNAEYLRSIGFPIET